MINALVRKIHADEKMLGLVQRGMDGISCLLTNSAKACHTFKLKVVWKGIHFATNRYPEYAAGLCHAHAVDLCS